MTVDTLQTPKIELKSGYLVATPAHAEGYQWTLNGEPITGQKLSSIPESESGSYQVKISSGTCSKVSSVFMVTGLGEPVNSAATVYPNPFTNKITVTLPEPVTGGTAVLYNVLGQPVQSATFGASDSKRAELRFVNLEPGSYVLGIGQHKFKVVKVN